MQCNILVISLKSFKATEVEKHEVDTFLKNVLILHCPEKNSLLVQSRCRWKEQTQHYITLHDEVLLFTLGLARNGTLQHEKKSMIFCQKSKHMKGRG